MREIFYIHPLGQLFGLFFGIFNLVTGITRKWFSVAIHINVGILFYVTSLLGAGVGVFVARYARHTGIPLDMQTHKAIAMVLIVLLALGATTGFMLLSKKAVKKHIVLLHRWVNVLNCVLFTFQGVIGLMSLMTM